MRKSSTQTRRPLVLFDCRFFSIIVYNSVEAQPDSDAHAIYSGDEARRTGRSIRADGALYHARRCHDLSLVAKPDFQYQASGGSTSSAPTYHGHGRSLHRSPRREWLSFPAVSARLTKRPSSNGPVSSSAPLRLSYSGKAVPVLTGSTSWIRARAKL